MYFSFLGNKYIVQLHLVDIQGGKVVFCRFLTTFITGV